MNARPTNRSPTEHRGWARRYYRQTPETYKSMKLAEALQIRADLQRRIAQMPARLANNATVQEGSAPAEQPDLLLEELQRTLSQLEELTVKINLANSRPTDNGSTMTAMLAQRDTLKRHIDIMRGFLNAASDITPRHTLTEIRVMSTVDVAVLRKECDSLSKRLRELEIKIQSLNWTIELE